MENERWQMTKSDYPPWFMSGDWWRAVLGGLPPSLSRDVMFDPQRDLEFCPLPRTNVEWFAGSQLPGLRSAPG
jgi:hypothetical protein